MEDFSPICTSPITEALGATNAESSITGVLSNRFIKVRCLDTANMDIDINQT